VPEVGVVASSESLWIPESIKVTAPTAIIPINPANQSISYPNSTSVYRRNNCTLKPALQKIPYHLVNNLALG
jgi:hypothetical protein